MKILVVDDEKVLVKGIKFNLESEGYQVEAGYDGEEAVELARSGRTVSIIGVLTNIDRLNSAASLEAAREQARTVLREVKVLKEMASQQGETMSGPLHIGLIPTIGPYLLPHIIPMLHQTFPKLEMYLHEAQTHQLLAQLDSGKLDCAILALVKESEAFIEVPLFDEPMMLAIYEDHPWANRDRVPMADLAGEKLLMLEDGHCLRDQAMGFCFEAGADEDTHFRATSLETLRNMVAAGSGITLLPALAVPQERKRDGVVYIPCIKPEPRRTIGLVYRPGSPLRSRYEQLAEAIRARMDGHFDKVLKQAV